MTVPTVTIDPMDFLMQAFQMDQLAAVRLADKWSTYPESTRAQYDAACHIMKIQSALPRCPFCTWALLPEEPHEYCEMMIQVNADDYDMDEDDLSPDYPTDDEDDDQDELRANTCSTCGTYDCCPDYH